MEQIYLKKIYSNEVKIRGPDQGPGPIPEDDEFVSTFGVNDTNHKRMAYTAFWAKAPPGRKKIFQKEQPVMVMKPS